MIQHTYALPIKKHILTHTTAGSITKTGKVKVSFNVITLDQTLVIAILISYPLDWFECRGGCTGGGAKMKEFGRKLR